MTITFTWQTLITAAAVVGAVVALTAYFVRLVLWFDKQNKQDKRIQEVQEHHDEDMNAIKEEMSLLVFGVQACLEGLQAQGCNGAVTEASKKFKAYLNEQAHKRKE